MTMSKLGTFSGQSLQNNKGIALPGGEFGGRGGSLGPLGGKAQGCR